MKELYPSGWRFRSKKASLVDGYRTNRRIKDAAAAELSEEAMLKCDNMICLLPKDHPGISEVVL